MIEIVTSISMSVNAFWGVVVVIFFFIFVSDLGIDCDLRAWLFFFNLEGGFD